MCACKQKKSFFIEDILRDVKKKPYRNLSNEPTQPLTCSRRENPKKEEPAKPHAPLDKVPLKFNNRKAVDGFNLDKTPHDVERREDNAKVQPVYPAKHNTENIAKDYYARSEKDYKTSGFDQAKFNHEKVKKFDDVIKFNVIAEVQNEVALSKISLEQRRNTYPLYPVPMKANISWHHKKEPPYNSLRLEPQLGYYSDPMLSTGLLRNQLAVNRFVTHPYTIRQAYGFERVPPNCCSPWWGLGGRRKGGQVRFTAIQTGALERRFNANKYLSPDERRALANTLRLSDRQVKTWFQNRRAKWRRTTPESADAGSPPTADEGSEDEIHNIDDD